MLSQKIFPVIALLAALAMSGCSFNQNSSHSPTATIDTSTFTRENWQTTLAWPEDCNALPDNYSTAYTGVAEHQINDEKSIVLVDCFSGAYQVSYKLYSFDKLNDSIKELSLPFIDEQGEINFDTEFSGIASQDFAETGDLSLFYKAAGHGGCGYFANYAWDETSEKYELLLENLYFDCDDPLMPDEWPTVFSK